MAIELSDNAQRVLIERRYRWIRPNGTQESEEEMFERVARTVAGAETHYSNAVATEKWAEQFYEIMSRLEFLPNTPTLINAGKKNGMLAACFVLPVEDDMASIFTTIRDTALTHQAGGGTGFDFSKLRPAGDIVNSTGGIASGPLSFMEVFNAATEIIKQGGTRRGANMGVLRVDHPNIREFITCKASEGRLSNFNISVAITGEFMAALKEGKDYPLVNPRSGEVVEWVSAQEIFNAIVEGAWRNGEPGAIFLDHMNDANPLPGMGLLEATNPCGEQPLLPYEACNLGSINLAKMLTKNMNAGKWEVDFKRLEEVVEIAVRFLDDVIDVSAYPIPTIAKMVRTNRKIGLGVMGFADMLIRLGVRYDSEEAEALARQIMRPIKERATLASRGLAKTRGAFASFESSLLKTAQRNATLTTIAPTGSLSTIAGCSSGIEPLFNVAYYRNILDKQFVEVNAEFRRALEERGLDADPIVRQVLDKGDLRSVEDIPVDVRELFVTSPYIDPTWHVRMQAAFQESVDNAVSKTINFPKTATREDVGNAIRLAYDLGCKGLTVYRDDSREKQVLKAGRSKLVILNTTATPEKVEIKPKPRPAELPGVTYRVNTGCGHLFVTINHDEGRPFETFFQLGKSGGCASAQMESMARLCALALRIGGRLEDIVDQLQGIICHRPAWGQGKPVLSCADAVAKSLQRYLAMRDGYEGEGLAGESKPISGVVQGACPECHSGALVHGGGCVHCQACGHEECMG